MILNWQSMILKKPRAWRTRISLAALLLISSVSLSSCKHGGPLVDICIVDEKREGFQCVSYKDKEYYLPFLRGSHLLCSSPYDTEDFLKACKKGQVLIVTLCSYDLENKDFKCKDKKGQEFHISSKQAENYACFTSQHRKRIIERCGEED
jgi:hypothetical protein